MSAAALLKRNPKPTDSRGEGRARSQSVPLRLAQPHGARGAARGGGDGSAMTAAPSASAPNCRSASRPTRACRHGSASRRDGRVSVSPGKVEIGQGIVTALAQIAADELDVDIARVQMVRASTAGSPNEGVTSGSLSIQQSGRALRQACAEVRRIFLERRRGAARCRTDALDVVDGAISGPGNVRTSYWELADEVSLDRDATPGAAPKIVGAARAGRTFGAAARHSRQGFRPAAFHPRPRICPACCTGACCGRSCRARGWLR